MSNSKDKISTSTYKKTLKDLKSIHKDLLKAHKRSYEGDYSLSKDSKDYKSRTKQLNDLQQKIVDIEKNLE